MFPFHLTWPSPTEASLMVTLYVVLAVAVSVDVLLKKSDVRSAMGWIGAVWLAPIFGSLLYYMFGINRVTRRALKLGRLDEALARSRDSATPVCTPNIALLSDVSRQISESPLCAGNELIVLEGGDQAYPAMLEAIRGARQCIAMSSYIFRNDS